MRRWHELHYLSLEQMTKDEQIYFCRIKLMSTKGEEYKKWFDVLANIRGSLTFDERVKEHERQSTPTNKGVDYSPERQYRGY